MKEILFATGNAAKVARFKEKLIDKGILLKSLKDLGTNLDIEENGKTAIENATIKAKTYYEATKMTTIAMDDTMYIDDIPDDKQPGVFVRRVNGKRLNDEEMLNYYTNLVKTYGKDGKLNTKWILGLVIIKDGKISTYTDVTSEYYLVDTPAKDMREGYPLSSILVNKKVNKYDIYLTDEDKKIGQADDSGFIEFIEKTLEF
ncbi:MAG: non-canonical purine NTP pyrophosphatase [Clostridia bacterium]|nr:non-canonical purine NTP pyrophosphatase [Clostridia bacterium]